jgi:hypothetical protein
MRTARRPITATAIARRSSLAVVAGGAARGPVIRVAGMDRGGLEVGADQGVAPAAQADQGLDPGQDMDLDPDPDPDQDRAVVTVLRHLAGSVAFMAATVGVRAATIIRKAVPKRPGITTPAPLLSQPAVPKPRLPCWVRGIAPG